MPKIKTVVLLVRQLRHGFTKNSPNLTVAQIGMVAVAPSSEQPTHIFAQPTGCAEQDQNKPLVRL